MHKESTLALWRGRLAACEDGRGVWRGVGVSKGKLHLLGDFSTKPDFTDLSA